MAWCRRAMTAPGRPANRDSGWASNSRNRRLNRRSSMPGKPSAERILRSTVAVSSRRQSIARCACRSSGCQPCSGLALGSDSGPRAASTRTSAARTAPTAPSLTSWWYRLLLRAVRIGNDALAHTGPASNSAVACRTVTPQRSTPRRMAQSSADGPRSPGGPGCTMRQRHRCQTDGGMARFRKGARTTSGRNRSTASQVTRSWMSSSTDSVWPSRVSSTWSRCARAVEGVHQQQDAHQPTACAAPRRYL